MWPPLSCSAVCLGAGGINTCSLSVSCSARQEPFKIKFGFEGSSKVMLELFLGYQNRSCRREVPLPQELCRWRADHHRVCRNWSTTRGRPHQAARTSSTHGAEEDDRHGWGTRDCSKFKGRIVRINYCFSLCEHSKGRRRRTGLCCDTVAAAGAGATRLTCSTVATCRGQGRVSPVCYLVTVIACALYYNYIDRVV